MFKYITLIAATIFLSGCFLFGEPTEFDETSGQSPEWIFDQANIFLDSKDYRKTVDYLEKLVKRYPDSKIIAQARINLSFAYYKFGQNELSLKVLQDFMTLYPSHPLMDYAFYLKGLNLYNERNILNKLTFQDISDRDVNKLKDAFNAFEEIIKRYPNSKYAQDSIDRMTYIMNKIAEYELHVARYYMKRRAYIAALNRAKYLYTNYPESIHVKESLVIQYIAYKELKLKDLEISTKKIIDFNYPEEKITLNYAEENKKWWEFWKSLTD